MEKGHQSSRKSMNFKLANAANNKFDQRVLDMIGGDNQVYQLQKPSIKDISEDKQE